MLKARQRLLLFVVSHRTSGRQRGEAQLSLDVSRRIFSLGFAILHAFMQLQQQQQQQWELYNPFAFYLPSTRSEISVVRAGNATRSLLNFEDRTAAGGGLKRTEGGERS